MSPAQKRDAAATKAAILDAAEGVFLEKGFADTSTAEIARQAGITKSLIHHHFGSKKELWAEVKSRRFGEYALRQHEMFEHSQSDAELLRESLKLYFAFLEKNPEVIRLLAWMFLEDDDECSDLSQQLSVAGVEKIRLAQQSGDLRSDIDPAFILFAFLALSQYWFEFRDHFSRDVGLDGAPEDLNKAYLPAMLKIFFEGVLPR